MHKYKFSGHNHSVLYFKCEKDSFLNDLWDNTILGLVQSHLMNIQNSFYSLQDLIKLGSVYVDQLRLPISSQPEQCKVAANTLLRIHLDPKRYLFDWERLSNLLLLSKEDFILLDKPAGVPIHPTLDNAVENILYQSSKVFLFPLFSVHRLDVETQGVIVLAKNEMAQKKLNLMFQDRNVKKYYRAIVTQQGLELGMKTHWMLNSDRAPKKLSDIEMASSKICQLKILKVSKIEDQSLKERFSLRNEQEDLQQIEIELLTGRTHQIRAQLSHMGFPILGDTLYGGEPHPCIALQSCCIQFSSPFTNEEIKVSLY
ncbi:MAG: RNA pseudouridine synthase [Bdellovibrionales bacterium]|nr:RNA pseudouridine synthase [Bdellovibrionales bacterium]